MKHQDIEALPKVSQTKIDLIAAKALISDPDHWCRNTWTLNTGEAMQRCSDSALRAAIPFTDARYDNAYRVLLAAIPQNKNMATSVERFNDTHYHADVMKWWDRVIEMA